MPHSIDTLAKRIARLGRRIAALERGSRRPQPAWRDLPLTGDTAIPDPDAAPQMRITPWDTLELSGLIGIPGERVTDEAVFALLPEDYRPTGTRVVQATSNARTAVHLHLTPPGQAVLRVPSGRSTKANWLSLDGLSCRLDSASAPRRRRAATREVATTPK